MEEIRHFDGDHEFLSNFAPNPAGILRYKGEFYPTVEHFFQAMKTENKDLRHHIATVPTPGKAKRMGRRLALRADWQEIRDDVMLYALRHKFDSPLAYKLVETGEAKLVEGNEWHDDYWGDCFCPIHKHTPGENKLGKLLMQVREECKQTINGEDK